MPLYIVSQASSKANKSKLTIDHRYQVRFLVLPTIDVCNDAYKLIDCNVVHTPLEMKLQILSLVAIELTVDHYDTDLLGQPSWRRPQLLVIRTMNGCIDHQDLRNAVDGLASVKLLITLASVAPSPSLVLSLDALFQYL